MWEIYKAIEDFFGIDRSDEKLIEEAKKNTETKTETKTSNSSGNTTKNNAATSSGSASSKTNAKGFQGNSSKTTNEVVKKEAEKTAVSAVDGFNEGIIRYGSPKTKQTVLKGLKSNEPIIENEAQKQAEKISVSLINKIKDVFGPAGSTDIIREEVGMLIPRGIAMGIEKNSDEAIDLFEEYYAYIGYQREMDVISEDEYYSALESLRDEFFAKGSDKWLYYTSKIYKYQKDLLANEKERYKETYDEIFEYAAEKIDAVIKKQRAYEEKLQSYGRVFQKNTILLDEGNIEFYSLGDLKTQNAELERYASLMLQAKQFIKESGLSEEAMHALLEDISSLPVHSASTALEALIKSPLSKDWLAEYEKRVHLSKTSATLYYKDDFDEAIDESTEYMTKKLSDAGYEIPETFFDIGKDAAIRFGEGFSFGIGAELEKIRSQIVELTTDVSVSLVKNDGGETIKTGDEINTTNYYITSSLNEDATDTIKRYEAIKRLGGYK